jgi:hypothetical protein
MASVEFERSRSHVQLTVTCAGEVAQAQVATGEDDRPGHD